MIASVQPIVLAGGRSRRFGRDKLREPLGDGWLIDRPVAALREVFGRCVAVVGECDPVVAARADLAIPDRYPGAGPMGGILSALEETGRPIFVLAGDLPLITGATVRAMLKGAGAGAAAGAWAVLAEAEGVEPCVGLYRPAARDAMAARVARGELRLRGCLPPARVVLVPVDAGAVRNANFPGDLSAE